MRSDPEGAFSVFWHQKQEKVEKAYRKKEGSKESQGWQKIQWSTQYKGSNLTVVE